MKEALAVEYIKQRVRDKGFAKYRMVHHDFNLRPSERIELAAYNEFWIMLEASYDIQISSPMGKYGRQLDELSEEAHEHIDEISIYNPNDGEAQVSLIQVILQE
ncbi:MAG: hypothetical protein WBA74_07395 [Cyclobacteriaceae bacterium]